MSMLIPMKLLRNVAITTLMGVTPFSVVGEEFHVMMLNSVADDAQNNNVFTP